MVFIMDMKCVFYKARSDVLYIKMRRTSDFKVIKFSRFYRSTLQHRYVAIQFIERQMSILFRIFLRNVEMYVDNYRLTQITAVSSLISSYT